MLDELEQPRFTSCSFFPYSLSDLGEVVFLMRNKKDSKNSPYYVGFGTNLVDYPACKDVNILFSAARSYLDKTGGVCLASELEIMANPAELNRRMQEYLSKIDEKFYVQNSRVREMFGTFTSNQMVIEILPGMPHVAFFYPLPYWRLDSVNKVYAESEYYRDLSLHWIPLAQLIEPEFHNRFLTAFDFEVLSLGAQQVVDKIFSSHMDEDDTFTQATSLAPKMSMTATTQPDHAVIIVDDREYLKGLVEGILYGNIMENGQKWQFYRANELDLPTMTELKGLKSLIIWSSTLSPTLKDSEDASYPSWVRPVLKLIKSAYSQFPNLKILGIQAGSHLLATAFGGKVVRKEMDETQKILHNQAKGLLCGKDTIRMKESFYQLDYVDKVFGKYSARLQDINVYSVYETGLELTLPAESIIHGVSSRSGQPIIWTLKGNSRILGLQAHPSFNTNIMHELIVSKLYENGKIDDPLKIKFIEDIYDSQRPLMNNTLLKVTRSFLQQ